MTMPGDKTHDQQVRTFEHREGPNVPAPQPQTRESAAPASRAGIHQEDRDHNEHNGGGQMGHKPQSHTPAEEKR